MNAEDRLTAYLCQQPDTEHMDAHHADMARQILAQHAKELGREGDASYWRQRFENEANVRWDDGCPPGGMVCATCGEPVESEPCAEHNPKTILAAQTATTELRVISLADQLRATATALADLNPAVIAATDDPLTLLRCLHSTVEALSSVTPSALAAADLDGKAPYTGSGVADIPGRVAVGLGSATNALWDAYNAV